MRAEPLLRALALLPTGDAVAQEGPASALPVRRATRPGQCSATHDEGEPTSTPAVALWDRHTKLGAIRQRSHTAPCDHMGGWQSVVSS
jgi:hypothetical protein